MTEDQVARIELALGIILPPSYRAVVVPFSIPAGAGNRDLEVWDDADALIAYNLERRAARTARLTPWPAHFFALGHSGRRSPCAIDLDNGDAVWLIDRGSLDNPRSRKQADSFTDWAHEYFEDLREDLEDAGIDPDGTPVERALVERRNTRSALIVLNVVLLLAAVAAILVWGLDKCP